MQVQRALAAAGEKPGELDGIYGWQTAEAVRAFQERNGLPPDGVVGRETWETLGRVAGWSDAQHEGFHGVLHGAIQGDDVMAAQTALRADGLDPGVVDGVFGPNTERAVLEYQRKHGLKVTGVVDEATWEALGGAAVSRSYFPGYAADSLAGEDLLGIRERVDFLASVLAAKRLETPLAIGIFGDWGSGKSFFMRQLQNSIDRLVEHSAAAAQRSEGTYYCSNVRQVTFNAWLYADSDIWPNLAAQVFRSVSGDENEAPHGDTQTQELGRFHDRAMRRFRKLDDERHVAEVGEAVLDRRIDELAGELAAKRTEAAELAGPLGPEAAAVAQAGAAAHGNRLDRNRRAWRVMSGRERATLTAVVVVGIAVAAIAAIDSAWLATVVAVLVPVLAVLARVLSYVDATAVARLEMAELERRAAALQAERDRLAAERGDAERKVQGFRARPVLPQFAAEEAANWTARARPGTVTEIRLRFEELSSLIDANLRAREAGEERPDDVPPVERVIVYVDDLDRCDPAVVVTVLEAMKLLLALPHFVVIVGVDSRWLFRSLEVRFEQMLRRADGAQPDPGGTTPQSYLEKIFQYSLVLRPMRAEGFQRLVRHMLPIEAEPAPAWASVAEPAADSLPAPNGDGAAPPVREPPTAPAGPDLTPSDLVITRDEREFIVQLAPMFDTPRATKRLTNLYRLIRVAVGSERLLRDDAYQRLLLLLAVSLVYPAEAADFFADLREAAGRDETFGWVLQKDPTGSLKWQALSDLYDVAQPTALWRRQASDFTEWIPAVAEFSFHPWRELHPDA